MLTFYDLMCLGTFLLWFCFARMLIGAQPKKKSKRRRVWIEED